MDIKLTNWGGPWRNAPLRDRILMLGALHENGMRRSRIGEKLRVLPPLLNSAIDQLVADEWLRAEHPDDRPTRDSFYTLNLEREGLQPLMDYWYIEYGLVPGEAGWRPRREPDRGLSDEQIELLSEAVRSADQNATRSSPGKWCSGWILQVRWFRRSGRWSAVRGWSPPGRLPGW